MPFGVAEEANTQAVSAVRVFAGGSTDADQNGNVIASIYADNFTVSLDENPQNWTYEQLIQEIFTRSDAQGVFNNAALRANDVIFSIDGIAITPENYNQINWSVGSHSISMQVRGTNAIANVSMNVTEKTNVPVTPDNTQVADKPKALAQAGDVIGAILPVLGIFLLAALGFILFAWRRRKKDEEEASHGRHAR